MKPYPCGFPGGGGPVGASAHAIACDDNACVSLRAQRFVCGTKAPVKLTAEQRKRVREMMTDEGASRAEAVAWVLAFEPKVST